MASVADLTLSEGNGGEGALYKLEIVRSGNLDQYSFVNWSIVGSGSNPASASDFLDRVFPSGEISFAPGQTLASVSFQLAGDSIPESDEQFSVVLSNASAGTSITTSVATGTILNDDASLSISTDRSDYWEGNSGSTALTFTVKRSGFLNQVTSVGWAVAGTGTDPATAADFTGGVLPSGTVSFAAGETTKTITVNVAGDTQVEALYETFNVVLNSPSSGATITAASATTGAQGTILNDDGTPQLSLSCQPSIFEGDLGYAITITRDVNLSAPSSFNWGVTATGDKPVDAADFAQGVLPSGTITFGVGETTKTVYLGLASDKVVEPDETFTFALSNLQNAAIDTPSIVGTVTNDDTNWAISTTDVSKPEGNSGITYYTYTVTRLGVAPAQSTVLNWRVTGETASAIDFVNLTLPSGTLTFSPSETSKTFTVGVLGDSLNEADETFSVGLSTKSTEYPISTSAGSVRSTIVNDDASVGIIGGSSTADNLSGNAGNDSLYGYAGNDILYGLGGSDLLNGGTGADQLSGGADKDVFVFAAGDSGQSTTNRDRILDFSKGLAGTGDQLDYSANLTIGGSSAAASSTQAAINATTGVATFASGSGTTLTDALSDIASRFTAASNSAGEFALFKVNQTGNFYAFISDGYSGVTANDVVIELVGVTTINKIDLSLGNLSILS